MSAIINKGALIATIQRGLSRAKAVVLKPFNNIAFEKFERAKARLLYDVENHPVSLEIAAGQSIQNSSFLSGPGNLFSFLGFAEGTNPVDELIALLDAIIVFEPDNGLLDFRGLTMSASSRTQIPTESDLQILNLHWEPSISWVTAIEKGVSNLGYYLYVNSSASRSGKGIQAKHVTRSSNFVPVPYLTPLLEQFKRNLR